MNYDEGWELSIIQTKNAANEMRLNGKCQYVYIYDADMDEISRIVHGEWSIANRIHSTCTVYLKDIWRYWSQ
jgi:hypothetical protein